MVKTFHYSSMPVIMRFRTCGLTIYPNEHGTPHFHLEFTDGDRCSIAIETLEIQAGKLSQEKKAAEALGWAEKNRDLLLVKWKEITR